MSSRTGENFENLQSRARELEKKVCYCLMDCEILLHLLFPISCNIISPLFAFVTFNLSTVFSVLFKKEENLYERALLFFTEPSGKQHHTLDL